jgi:DNA-binding NarL/FixJ family response regulator
MICRDPFLYECVKFTSLANQFSSFRLRRYGRVVVVDIHQELQAGAMGYLIKGMSHEVLVRAIHKVHQGNRFLPPPVTQALSVRSLSSELSQRECEVLSLVVAGKSNREIGEKLHIKEATVKSHITVILMRLQVTDRTQAVVEALKRGLEHL